MGESEMNVMNGMSPCYAPSYVNTRGAQPGLQRLPNHVGTREMGPFRNTHQEQLSSWQPGSRAHQTGATFGCLRPWHPTSDVVFTGCEARKWHLPSNSQAPPTPAGRQSLIIIIPGLLDKGRSAWFSRLFTRCLHLLSQCQGGQVFKTQEVIQVVPRHVASAKAKPRFCSCQLWIYDFSSPWK